MCQTEAEITVLEVEYLALKGLELSSDLEVVKAAKRRAANVLKELERLRLAYDLPRGKPASGGALPST